MERDVLERASLVSMPGKKYLNLLWNTWMTIRPKSDREYELDPGEHQGHLLLHMQGAQLGGGDLKLDLQQNQ